jgi:hypothetical protein
MIDFPANPTNGQAFTVGNKTWTWDGVKWAPSGSTVMPPLSTGDNRIVNGDMRIDQRNNGASGTAVGVYTIDHWLYAAAQAAKGTWQRYAGPSLLPFGFSCALQFTSSSAYTPIAGDYFAFRQPIEADWVTDFEWGTPNAQPVTLSFLAFASVAGQYGGSFLNPPAVNRSYPFSFNLPASTWTKVSITIPGDTIGPWTISGNSAGVMVYFDLGSDASHRAPAGAWANGNFTGANGDTNVVATSGATFYITGVKLELGMVATPFNRQSLAKSMADCQRYFNTSYNGLAVGSLTPNGMVQYFFNGVSTATLLRGVTMIYFPVSMRAPPTMVYYSPATGATGVTRDYVSNADVAVGGQGVPGLNSTTLQLNLSVAATTINMGAHYTASAEI